MKSNGIHSNVNGNGNANANGNVGSNSNGIGITTRNQMNGNGTSHSYANGNGHGSSHTTPSSSTPTNKRTSLSGGTDKSYSLQYTSSSPLLTSKDPNHQFSSPSIGLSSTSSPSIYPHPHPHLPLPFRVRMSYGVGHILNDLVASCWFSYLLVFLRTVLLFQSTSAGLLLLIGQVADGMATPVVGFLSDQTESKFGKRRLWIMCGSIVVALTFPPIFHTEFLPYFATSNTLRVIYYGFFIVLFQFAWASVQVSHLALVPELTKEPEERVFLNSLRSIFTILSNVTVFVLAWFVIRSGGKAEDGTADASDSLGPADVESFFTLSLYVVVIGSVFSLFFLIGTPAPAPRHRHTARVEWYHWFAKAEFYQTAIIYTCTRLLVNVSQTYMPLYLLLSLQAPKATIASVPLTVFGSGLLSTCICEHLTRKLGSEGLTFVGCLTVLLSCVGIVYLPSGQWEYIYIIAILLGFGTGIVGVSALSLICNLVGESCESGAFVYGSMSFSDKIANGIAIMIAEALSPAVDSGQQHLYYRNVMLYAPGGAACLAIIMLGIGMIRGTNLPKAKPCQSSHGENGQTGDEIFEANLGADPATSQGSFQESRCAADENTALLGENKA